jgi:predicted component of type VI protein secretion system
MTLARTRSDPPDVAGAVVRLRQTHGEAAGDTIVVGCTPQLIGRHPVSDIQLRDITVSLRHAVARAVGRALEVTDLGSLNGTFVNGERVETAVLRAGDELRIGRFRMTLLPSSAVSAA